MRFYYIYTVIHWLPCTVVGLCCVISFLSYWVIYNYDVIRNNLWFFKVQLYRFFFHRRWSLNVLLHSGTVLITGENFIVYLAVYIRSIFLWALVAELLNCYHPLNFQVYNTLIYFYPDRHIWNNWTRILWKLLLFFIIQYQVIVCHTIKSFSTYCLGERTLN